MKVLNLSINIINSDVRAAAGVAANIFFIHVYLSTNILGRTQTVTSHIAKVHDLPVCVYFFISFLCTLCTLLLHSEPRGTTRPWKCHFHYQALKLCDRISWKCAQCCCLIFLLWFKGSLIWQRGLIATSRVLLELSTHCEMSHTSCIDAPTSASVLCARRWLFYLFIFFNIHFLQEKIFFEGTGDAPTIDYFSAFTARDAP